MKITKSLVISLLAFICVVGIANAYTVVGGDSMWKIAQNANLGLQELIGMNPQVSNPSLIYPGQEINVNNLGGSGGLPITDYQSTLTQPLTSSGTTINVASISTTDGHTITTADISPAVYLVLEPNNSAKKEIVKCTTVGTTYFSGCTRGLAFYGTTETEVSANKKSHGASSEVVLSNVHYYYLSLSQTNTWTGIQTFASSTEADSQVNIGTTTPIEFKNVNGVAYYKNYGSSYAAIGGGANTYSFLAPLTTVGSEVRLATTTGNYYFKFDSPASSQKLIIATSTIASGKASGTGLEDHWNARYNATTTKGNDFTFNATTTALKGIFGTLTNATNTLNVVGDSYVQGNSTSTRTIDASQFCSSGSNCTTRLNYYTLDSMTNASTTIQTAGNLEVSVATTTLSAGQLGTNGGFRSKIMGFSELSGSNIYFVVMLASDADATDNTVVDTFTTTANDSLSEIECEGWVRNDTSKMNIMCKEYDGVQGGTDTTIIKMERTENFAIDTTASLKLVWTYKTVNSGDSFRLDKAYTEIFKP